MAALSPYLTRHIKRFGDYVLDPSAQPDPLDEDMAAAVATISNGHKENQ